MVHPDSDALLKKHGKDLPEGVSENYRLLYERNSGIGNDGDSPEINGLLVAKKPFLTMKDVAGAETASDSWGNTAGVFHLNLEAREKAAEFLVDNPRARIALVVDNNWVFYDGVSANVRPKEGLVFFEVLDRLDEDRFQNLYLGKRGQHIDDPLPVDGPPAPPVPAPTYIGE